MGMVLPKGVERKALAAAGRLVPSVVVPAPPSTNAMNRFLVIDGRVRPVPSKEYREWQEAALPVLLTLASPAAYPVAVRLDLLGKWNKNRDIDNVAKPTLDGIVKAGVLAGDSIGCIVGLTVWLLGGPGEPTVKISFEAVTPNLFGG